jgi:hypothetical protein
VSTFTPNKNLEQPAAGSDNNTWATPVNNDWAVIDTAFGGLANINVTGVGAGSYVMNFAQITPPNIVFNGTMSANLTFNVPTGVGGFWSVFNNTGGAFTLTFGSAGGGSQVIPQGQRVIMITDGANMSFAQTGGALPGHPTSQVALTAINGVAATYMPSDAAPALNQSIAPTWTGAHIFDANVTFANSSNVALNGGFTVEAAATIDATLGNLFAATQSTSDNSVRAATTAFVRSFGALLLVNSGLTGIPTAPTAAQGTSTTQLATTAFAVGSASLTANGHVVLPSGLIIQWGISTFSSGGSSITFSGVSGCIAFPNSCFWASVCAYGASATAFVSGFSSTQLTALNGISGQNAWLAIGY